MSTRNPFLPANDQPTPDTASLFGSVGAAPKTTEHHGYALPSGLRDYEPTYSFGKYVLPDIDGGDIDMKATRVTTGVKALDDTTGLTKWQLRETVHGLKVDPDLLEDIDLYGEPRDVNRDLDRVVDKALIAAGTRRASELGTAVHAWLEAVDGGAIDPDDVPGEFQPYVRAYLAKLAEYGIRPIPSLIERIVYDPATGWVGTFDRVYQLANGVRVIGDVKTSKTTSFRYGALSFAQQTATYARAGAMLSADGTTWGDMPEVSQDFALIVNVPSDEPGKCLLHTLDLQFGRDALDLAEAVRQCRAAATRHVDTFAVPTIVDAIQATTSAEELSDLWERYADMWTDELTLIGQKHLQSL